MIEKFLKKIGVPVQYIPGQKWIASALILGTTALLRTLHVDLSVVGIPATYIQFAAVFLAHYLWSDSSSVRL